MNRFLVSALLTLCLLAGASALVHANSDARWICPPCAAPCDTTVFHAPGTCPACGMKLVDAASAAAQAANTPDSKKVAILVFPGVQIIDFTGPYEMFGAVGCDVYTVAATKDPVTTSMGMTILPRYTFADAPAPDVLVVPGGGVLGPSKDEATLRFVRDTSAQTEHTLSVCNGAFILASAGLLDGLSATTTNGNIPRLASQFPKVTVVRDKRYVDNGKIVTAAGLSAGIDGALHVIDRMFGTGAAEQVALGEEYDWKAGADYARAALADHEIPNIQLDGTGDWNVVRTEGDRDRWHIVLTGKTTLSPADLENRLDPEFTNRKWTKLGADSASPNRRTSTWRFTGSDGTAWGGTLKIENAGPTTTAEVSVARTAAR